MRYSPLLSVVLIFSKNKIWSCNESRAVIKQNNWGSEKQF